jgi:hypothetical protein
MFLLSDNDEWSALLVFNDRSCKGRLASAESFRVCKLYIPCDISISAKAQVSKAGGRLQDLKCNVLMAMMAVGTVVRDRADYLMEVSRYANKFERRAAVFQSFFPKQRVSMSQVALISESFLTTTIVRHQFVPC